MLGCTRFLATILLVAGGAAGVAAAPSELQTLTPDEAVKVAVAKNPRYLSSLKLVDSAQAILNQAYSPYYPTVDLTLSSTNYNNGFVQSVDANGQTVITGGAGNQRLNASSVSVNYTILDFGRRKLNVKSLEASLQAARETAEATRQDIVVGVRQQFYLTQTDQEALRIQQEQVKNQNHHLRQAQGYYKAGLQARIEVTKAASDLANAELNLVQAKNTLELDWVSLNVAMGLPRDTAYHLELPPVEQSFLDTDPAKLVDLAYASRPEALNFKAQIDYTLLQMEIRYANRAPTISAAAGTGVRGNDLPLPLFWTAGLVLNLNIFNGYLDRYAADSLRAQAESLAQQLEQERQQIYKDVMSAYLTLSNARQAIVVSRSNLSSSTDNYRLADQRYTAGLGSNLEYQDAQILLSRSRIGEITAQNNYRTAVAQLCRAVGVVDPKNLDLTGHPQSPPPIKPTEKNP